MYSLNFSVKSLHSELGVVDFSLKLLVSVNDTPPNGFLFALLVDEDGCEYCGKDGRANFGLVDAENVTLPVETRLMFAKAPFPLLLAPPKSLETLGSTEDETGLFQKTERLSLSSQ